MAHDARRNSYMGSTSYPQYDPSIYTDPRAYQSATPSYIQQNKSSSYANNFESSMPVNSSYIPSGDFQQHIPPPPPNPPPSAQPTADAVNHEFDNNSATAEPSRDMAARITALEQVIHSLRAELNTNTNTAAPPVQSYVATANMPSTSIPMPIPPPPPNPPAPAASFPPAPPFSPSHARDSSQPFVAPGSIPGSSSMAGMYGSSPPVASSSFATSRTLHTPPTPEHGTGVGADMDDAAYFDRRERRSSSRTTNESAPRDIPVRARQQSESSPGGGNRRENLNERYGERTREGSQSDRPAATRILSGEEETVLEKMWQPLFEGDRNPTLRLSQFLRGIALHLIEESEPKQSLVIGPKKMLRYFEKMKTSEESYPWNAIFGLPLDKLSKLYSTMECHHHLISRSKAPYEAPNLPALTPRGFASFMTILILASPDNEFERLAATLREYPIANADERKERWPKELSRRLLPRTSYEMAKRRLNDALSKVGILTKPSYIPPSLSTAYPSSQPNYSSSAPSSYQGPPPIAKTNSREIPPSAPSGSQRSSSQAHRNSYAQPPASTYNSRGVPSDLDSESTFSSDDEPDRRPSMPIERERKPYTAKEGRGKVHDEQNNGGNLSRTKSNTVPPPQPPPAQRPMSPRDAAGNPKTVNRSEVPNTSKTINRGEVPNSSSTTRNRERAPSIAASYTSSSGKRSNRGRSPPYGSPNTSFEATMIPPPAGFYPGNTYTPPPPPSGPGGQNFSGEEERLYGRDDPESRFARYDEDYRIARERTGGYGNPPLGSGERRYG